MTQHRRVLVGLLSVGLWASGVWAQAPPGGQRSGRNPTTPAARPGATAPLRAPQRRPAAAPAQRSAGDDSILATRTWTSRSNESYGFRNPGGVGRSAEFYPPGDRFQNDSPRHITAQIGNGGQPDRLEQLQAEQVGVMRYNSLQSHIDRYGAPFGYGYGFGMYYGLGFR
jgi:hypothetical protein